VRLGGGCRACSFLAMAAEGEGDATAAAPQAAPAALTAAPGAQAAPAAQAAAAALGSGAPSGQAPATPVPAAPRTPAKGKLPLASPFSAASAGSLAFDFEVAAELTPAASPAGSDSQRGAAKTQTPKHDKNGKRTTCLACDDRCASGFAWCKKHKRAYNNLYTAATSREAAENGQKTAFQEIFGTPGLQGKKMNEVVACQAAPAQIVQQKHRLMSHSAQLNKRRKRSEVQQVKSASKAACAMCNFSIALRAGLA
jgi:hypothetical protein